MKCAMCDKELYDNNSIVFVKKKRDVGYERVNDQDLLGAYKVQYSIPISQDFFYALDEECYHKLTHRFSFRIYELLRKFKKVFSFILAVLIILIIYRIDVFDETLRFLLVCGIYWLLISLGLSVIKFIVSLFAFEGFNEDRFVPIGFVDFPDCVEEI